MEKYVSKMKQKVKVPQEEHSLISSSRYQAPTSLSVDTRKTRDDGDSLHLHFRISCVSGSVMNLTSFAIERTDWMNLYLSLGFIAIKPSEAQQTTKSLRADSIQKLFGTYLRTCE